MQSYLGLNDSNHLPNLPRLARNAQTSSISHYFASFFVNSNESDRVEERNERVDRHESASAGIVVDVD